MHRLPTLRDFPSDFPFTRDVAVLSLFLTRLGRKFIFTF